MPCSCADTKYKYVMHCIQLILFILLLIFRLKILLLWAFCTFDHFHPSLNFTQSSTYKPITCPAFCFCFCFFFCLSLCFLLILLSLYLLLLPIFFFLLSSSSSSFFLFLMFLLFILLWERVSLCIPSCPRTHSVDQAVREIRDLHDSASTVLGFKVCATTASFIYFPSWSNSIASLMYSWVCGSPMEHGQLKKSYSFKKTYSSSPSSYQSPLDIQLLLINYVYLCVGAWHSIMRNSKEIFRKSILYFHCMCPANKIEFIRLSSRYATHYTISTSHSLWT